MRHTLLPLNERKALRRDYFIRLMIVFCVLTSVAGIIGIVCLVPAYFHVSEMADNQLSQAEKLKTSKENLDRAKIETELRSDAQKVVKLMEDSKRYRASSAIATLVSARGGVSINTLNHVLHGTSTADVLVQGTASTRDELLAFKSRILASFPDAKVDLPLSDLAKSKNISYSMRVTFKMP